MSWIWRWLTSVATIICLWWEVYLWSGQMPLVGGVPVVWPDASGGRCACSLAACLWWEVFHLVLKIGCDFFVSKSKCKCIAAVDFIEDTGYGESYPQQ